MAALCEDCGRPFDSPKALQQHRKEHGPRPAPVGRTEAGHKALATQGPLTEAHRLYRVVGNIEAALHALATDIDRNSQLTISALVK